MPRKALEYDVIGYLTMMVCYELGKTEAEVGQWHLEDVIRWVAFIRLKNKAEVEAMRKAQEEAKRRGARPNSTYTKY
jgi:hypothetical protein